MEGTGDASTAVSNKTVNIIIQVSHNYIKLRGSLITCDGNGLLFLFLTVGGRGHWVNGCPF